MPVFRYTDECLEAVERWSGHAAAPNKWSRQRNEGIVVFENQPVERLLGRAHPITPLLWFGLPIVYLLYRGLVGDAGVGPTVGLYAVGILIWTLLEYLMHRFLFHIVGKNWEMKFRAFMMHGYHHEFPNDRMRLVAPPLMSWPVAIVFSVLYYYIFGPTYWGPLVSGTMTGYIAYDYIHYYTHHARPKGYVGKFLRRYHMYHHYKNGDVHYGITSPLWDLVFGTFTPKDAPDSSGSGRADHAAKQDRQTEVHSAG